MLEGYSKEKLKKLCSESDLQQNCIRTKFWVSEVYGLGRALREYSYFYPKKKPLYVYSNHGPYFFGDIPKHELESEAPIQIYNSKKFVDMFRKKSKKPCIRIEWPYLPYIKRHGIKRVENPQGTIVYPSHSTPLVNETFDIQKYIEQLKALPEKFHPICICLHKHDIDKGVHETYLDAGFSVFTAGHYGDDRYIDRFYEIMKHFKYVTSNEVSSYTFYAINMAIPFFVYGENTKVVNIGDENYDKDELKIFSFSGYPEAYNLFLQDPFKEEILITCEQEDFVKQVLGEDEEISRLKMTIVLWWAFFAYRFNPVRMITKFIRLQKAKCNL